MHTDNIGKSSVLLDMVPESDILQAAMDIRIKRAVENRERIQAIKEQPITVPKGKFQTIVIDPPWPMEKIDRDTRPNQVGFDYPTMSEEDLMDWPLSKFAADNCHLYLWTTHRFLPMAMRLAEHWGFTYQCLMTWVKNVGMTPYSWMYSTEHVLFCRRGFLSLEKLGMRLDFRANVREHSRKPDIFYEIVRQASPGPRLDMFSREPREGFEQHGNEAAKFQGVTASTDTRRIAPFPIFLFRLSSKLSARI
jgi:N6-adenosine-specific RNA methylase IME4